MKYVFVAPDAESLCLQYRDFGVLPNCRLIKLSDFTRHYAKALNMIGLNKVPYLFWLVTPLFPKVFKELDNDEQTCFILYSRIYESFRGQICKYLRDHFPDCIITVYYGDLISRHVVSIDEVKKDVDLVLDFDEEDAKKNCVEWLLEPFSASIREIDYLKQKNNPIKWDVTFVGHAKNRYKKILELYNKLVDEGLTCDFHIVGVAESDRAKKEEIGYEPLSFEELLQHVVSARCVAEIMQDDGISPTTRYTEAMIFNKNLLTDCKAFSDEENCPPNVIYFEEISSISRAQLLEVVEQHVYDIKPYFKMFSVEQMIESITVILRKKNILRSV